VLGSIIFGYLFIFFARVTDVTLSTFRTLMLVRGKGHIAATIGFFEVMIYITALNKVMEGLSGNPLRLIVYALGFATGNYMGSFLEEKLAIGLATVQVITKDEELCEMIRQKGFGVTVIQGKGKDGYKDVLIVSLPRKKLDDLLDLLRKHDEAAFVTVMDTKATVGGYFKQTMKNK